MPCPECGHLCANSSAVKVHRASAHLRATPEAQRTRMLTFCSICPWCDFALLDIPGYTTQVWDAHAGMRIAPPLFDHWVNLFVTAVDELFEGEIAVKAKVRAQTIGWTFKEKMKAKLDHENQ
jgi:hypothetical protein